VELLDVLEPGHGHLGHALLKQSVKNAQLLTKVNITVEFARRVTELLGGMTLEY
jgi:hypothetical protein